MFDYSEIHIEISSRCILKCPRCPRTELSTELKDVLNQDYSLAEFCTIFPPEILKDIKSILFCGDKGDPIYARNFLGIVEYIKEHNPTLAINITTNGSYKSEDWWTNLGQALSPRDRITFSIDGWDHESNNMYRVNSEWSSIIKGLQTLSKIENADRPIIHWSTILFCNSIHFLD